MLAGSKLKMVQDLVASSTREELIWINGYLAGLVSGAAVEAEPAAPAKLLTSKITIAYGTESGNSKKLASTFAATAKGKGIQVKLVNLEQYRLTDLIKEEYFFAVISTQGDGEPPAGAKKFYDHIHLNGFKLNKMKYGVLALGDTSYPLFCKAGEDVDVQLKNLGGERIVDLQKCDTDYETDAGSWFTQVLQKLTEGGASSVTPATAIPVTGKKTTGKQFYTGTILSNVNLNDRGSNKQTHHIEIAVDGIEYQPGDSIGIIPENLEATVEAIIKVSGIDRNAVITYRNEEISVYDLLRKKLNISFLPERVIRRYAEVVKQDIPATNICLLDLLKIYSVKDAAQFEEVLDILEPITPRLYSIASSLEAHDGEVHITVSRDRFCVNEEWKFGLCSDYLALLPENTQLQFYVHKNNRFRLPSPEKDIIMIGPGTGVAPFRSFLAERDATGASGRNWLFFGEQHFESDFLYQTEIQNWHDTGVLTKVNVAFSRDQQEKIYVQHKMQQHGAELFQWLESGAIVYVCGAKEPMSVDVEHALVDIISRHGNKSTEESLAYLEELKESDRYLADVY
jgi:sulfite reductase (NADPH) flavoprotein alpha-component